MSDKLLSWEEVGKHIIPSDCWVVIHQQVYNVTDFLVEHPGGDDVLVRSSGLDATQKFEQANHSEYANSLKNARLVGRVESKQYPEGYEQKIKDLKKKQNKKPVRLNKVNEMITYNMVRSHKSEESCWVIFDKDVYDVTSYLEEHPGGLAKIMQYAGKDATQAFEAAGHSVQAFKKRDQFKIGTLGKEPQHTLIAVVAVVLILLMGVVSTFY